MERQQSEERLECIETRLAEIGSEITRLLLATAEDESFDSDVLPRIRELHAERDALDAEAMDIRQLTPSDGSTGKSSCYPSTMAVFDESKKKAGSPQNAPAQSYDEV